MSLLGFSDEQIEESRRRNNVPADWVAVPCENECGDLVWVPADIVEGPAHSVCSTACATQMILR